MREIIHLITPGDHYSPSTGSAIPTVVHGLSRARAAGAAEPSVLVARGTYPDRYPSARAIEYEQAPPWPLERVAPRRIVDGGLAALGMPRWVIRRTFRPAFVDQGSWTPSFVLCHNAPQAIPLVDHRRHVPVLYAHNNLLRSYSRAESARVLRHARLIVCVSQSLADETKENLPSSMHARVVVVRNGVDTAAFQRAPARDDGRPLQVAFVGRMLPEKGAGVVIDAFRRLDRDDLRLRIVGSRGFDSGAALSDFELEIRRAAEPLGDRVEFSPFVPRDQVARILGDSDIVVVPSTWREPVRAHRARGHGGRRRSDRLRHRRHPRDGSRCRHPRSPRRSGCTRGRTRRPRQRPRPAPSYCLGMSRARRRVRLVACGASTRAGPAVGR